MVDIPDVPDLPDLPAIPDVPDVPDIQSTPGAVTITTTHQLIPAKSSPVSTGLPFAQPQSSQASAMLLGMDSLVLSSADLLANAQSKDYLGGTPQFWGRYFYAPGQINSSGKRDTHYSAAESPLLRANNIRVLPIARQTANVRQPTKAKADAVNNVAAIFEVFSAQYLSGADPDVVVFLDVEQSTSLAAGYYEIWSDTIVSEAARISNDRVRFYPAVYGSRSDESTWKALKQAMDGGSACYGVWVARYYYPTPVPKPWSDPLTTLPVTLACPILAWQYWASPDDASETTNFDTNLACPAHSDMLLSRLVMPPS
ncbi:MAG TPA: hypothetical protein VKW08_23165 [Xanthobacteraceae bacterium]|nr:hypothetical protein [Xanthobacteraceae bacterium]